jgi:hypothetical protein
MNEPRCAYPGCGVQAEHAIHEQKYYRDPSGIPVHDFVSPSGPEVNIWHGPEKPQFDWGKPTGPLCVCGHHESLHIPVCYMYNVGCECQKFNLRGSR